MHTNTSLRTLLPTKKTWEGHFKFLSESYTNTQPKHGVLVKKYSDTRKRRLNCVCLSTFTFFSRTIEVRTKLQQ